jgi:hypothetical protein
VIDELVDLAMRRPGFVALLLSIISSLDAPGTHPHVDTIGEVLFTAFATVPDDDLTRTIRVVGALGALAVGAVACHDHPAGDVRRLLSAVSYDALGHPRPTAN